jgi:hypothetical protein
LLRLSVILCSAVPIDSAGGGQMAVRDWTAFSQTFIALEGKF